MAVELDEIDIMLLHELQRDADRSNVELSRIVGLSPAGTLNRVRRLKESGVVRRVVAHLDPVEAGFPLQVYVLATQSGHDVRADRGLAQTVRAIPQVISAVGVAGDVDVLLHVVARDVAELQQVLARLSTQGHAQRLVTLLMLEEIKPPAPLPLSPSRSTHRARR